MNGFLVSVVGGIIRQLNVHFIMAHVSPEDTASEGTKKVRIRQYAYETLLELALNLYGMESRWLSAAERCQCLTSIRSVLAEWEEREIHEGNGSVSAAVLRCFLERMKLVQKGASMVARTAERIEQALDLSKPFLLDFLDRAHAEIEGNIYTRMIRENRGRFGNDYALGLRWLRHLGFEQVSTNPMLAAMAYSDDPALPEAFQSESKRHSIYDVWNAAPEKHKDEIALYATLLALWENLHVFRPIFFNLADSSGGGVVSFQLNPNIAHLVQESVRDVFIAFAEASEDLAIYDRYLLAGYSAMRERGRPNIVIKVAASSPAAREIARIINACGFGSNITVVYTASQEVTMILEELAGMAETIRKGITPTQLYMTNMGGRFESHLREIKLEGLFGELKQKLGAAEAVRRVEQLAASNGSKPKVDQAKGYEAKVVAATRVGNQRTIDHNVITALKDIVSEEELKNWEDILSKSGTLVARRVWGIFWSNENRRKWVDYLTRKYQITAEQAGLILSRVYYLPAAKRRPQDTFCALSGANMVHTELPIHQDNVRRFAEAPEFKLEDYAESISQQFPPSVLTRLETIPDFRRGYELNHDLNRVLREVGIAGDYGEGGHTPAQWAEYGSVQKTLADFKAAYDKFRDDMVALLKTAGSEADTVPEVAREVKSNANLAKKARINKEMTGRARKNIKRNSPKAHQERPGTSRKKRSK